MDGADEGQAYDRQLLLGGPKRDSTLELWEVQRYGTDSYSDPEYVSIYGLRPSQWYSKGIRLLGRTAVECTRDSLADAIGAEIAIVAARTSSSGRIVVIDPFTGSGNTLYWMLRHLPSARGVGFELDDGVFELTQRNLALLDLSIEVLHADCASGLARVAVAEDELVVAFLAPPWGDALNVSTGLDLRRTTPPIGDIVDLLVDTFAKPLLCAIQVYERVDHASLLELEARFDWSELRTFELNAPGENHGVVLAGRRWPGGQSSTVTA